MTHTGPLPARNGVSTAPHSVSMAVSTLPPTSPSPRRFYSALWLFLSLLARACGATNLAVASPERARAQEGQYRAFSELGLLSFSLARGLMGLTSRSEA